MTTMAEPAARGIGVNLMRVMRSEWVKFRSLRSSYWTLAIAAALLIGFAAFITSIIANAEIEAEVDLLLSQAQNLAMTDILVAFLVNMSLGGLWLAQLAIGVLGVLMVTGEYSTGMVRASFAAVPGRTSVIIAKAVVAGLVVLVTMTVAAFAAFFLAQVVLAGRDLEISLSGDGVVRALFGVGLYTALLAIAAGALGWLLRSAAAAISVLVGILILLPIALALVPVDWVADIVEYLPGNAGQAIVTLDLGIGREGPFGTGLGPWEGLAVFVAWTLVALIGAAYVVRRRDA
jgi:ABC-type transport system involved in multi-copper enzyme maturation permease subunit